jgi:hypothetical protein
MQLTILSLAIFLLFWAQELKAQTKKWNPLNVFSKSDKKDKMELDSTIYENPIVEPVELDILASYYKQDGNNAAVTGGIGTELLTDYTSKVILSIPMNQKLKLNLDAGADYYSSASTDAIDHIVSSDSESDTRVHGNIGFSYKINEQQTWGARLGGSSEYDYQSLTAGFNYNWQSKNENTAIGFNAQAFIDKWDIIYPREIRREVSLPTDKRQSYNASLTFSQVLNKRMQVALQLEMTYMSGLLSTPFHRVYFKEQQRANIEILPDKRLKIPIGLRFNYYVAENVIARFYYRYYQDDWGMQAHTASIELPIKLNRFLSIYPFYRYHTQTAVDYFKPYKEHSINDQYRTSDYDLADLDSQTYGLGFRYSPVDGIGGIKLPFKKRPLFLLKSIDLKYSHFERSTGLKADIISLGLSFRF